MTRVALLHGLGADRRAFQRFERLLPDAWTVRAFDLLGHGEAPKPERGYSLEDHARYVAGQIDAWRAGAPVVVVGHSYGAGTAVALAALHPEVPAGIVLLDPIVYRDADVPPETARVAGKLAHRTDRMMQARREGTLPATIAELWPHESEALRRWTAETWQTMALGVIDEIDHTWTRFADRVRCPVAILHGDLELGGGGDLAVDWFDEPWVRRVPGAGHYLHATHARETAAALADAVEWAGSQLAR